MAVALSELDPKFKYEVAAQPGGENIKACFACGVCTACCPVSEVEASYNPRRIIRMVLLGMRKEVLESDFIWLCASCYACYAQCPQNVKFKEVMAALREMAAKEGYVHPSFLKNIKAIDQLSQKIRRDLVLKVVEKKKEAFEVDAGQLLRSITP